MLESEHRVLFAVGFIVYVCFMIFIGWIMSRKGSEGTNFLTGGRNLPTFLIFSTIGATMIGTGSAIGATSNGFIGGWAGASYGLGATIALVLIAFLFSSMRDKNFITMSEENQYYYAGSIAVRKVTGVLILVAEIVLLTNHMNGGAKYLEFVMGGDFNPALAKVIVLLAFTIYVIVGGYLAVVWTDAIQLVIILLGFGLIIFKAIPAAGGWAAIETAYVNANNPGALSFYGLSSIGIPATLAILLSNCLGEMGAPTFRMRIYTAKDSKTAKKAFLITAVVVLLFSLVPCIVGMAAFTIATNSGAAAILANPDFAFAYLSTNVLGPAFGLILLIAGLSATMSSGDSDAIAGVTILIEDVYPIITGKRIPEHKIKSSSRIGIILILLVAFVSSLSVSGVIAYLSNVIGSLMPGLVITMIFGRLWKRVTPIAGVTSMVVGTLFGVANLAIKPLNTLLVDVFGGPVIPVSLVVAIIVVSVTLVTKRPDISEEDVLKKVLKGRTDL